MRIRLIIFLLLWFYSFSMEKGYCQSFLDQANTEIINIEDFLLPSGLVVIDNLLFIKNERQDPGIVVYDLLKKKEIFRFGKIGRGPAEYLNFTIHNGPGEDLLEISDTANRKNDVYDVSCIKQNLDLETISNCIVYSVANAASGIALIQSRDKDILFNKGSSPEGILWVSEKENIQRYLTDVPEAVKENYKKLIQASLASSGKIAANYERNSFAYFADSFDWALFYGLKSDTLELIKEHSYSYVPDFEVIDYGASSYLETGENYKAAFASPAAGKSHYFVLYSGKTAEDVEMTEGAEWRAFTNRIKVFDFNGNEIKEIKLDKDLFVITVDYNENMIYGITVDRELNPSILKAKIK